MKEILKILTNNVLEYKHVDVVYAYDGSTHIRIIVTFTPSQSDMKEQVIVYNYNTLLGNTNIVVKSVNKTFEAFSWDALEEIVKNLEKFLIQRTNYTANMKKPIDIYGLFNKLTPLIKEKKPFLIKVKDLPTERVDAGCTPLFLIVGSKKGGTATNNEAELPFAFEVALNKGVPVLKLHNSTVTTKYNSENYKEIKPNDLVPLIVQHFLSYYKR